MKVFRVQDIPDAHKIAVYDALCAHFRAHLSRYYTYAAPQNPRYDSGVAADATECVGVEIEGGCLNVVMRIAGWADTLGFSFELPPLTRDDQTDEGAWIEVADAPPAGG